MKIALCMHGFIVNGGRQYEAFLAKEYIQRNILSKGEVDIFFHSWDETGESHRLASMLYDFKVVEYEKQKSFDQELNLIDVDWFEKNYNRQSDFYSGNSIFQTLSFLYSRKKAIELKTKYEKENNFEYDIVILARTDLGTRGKEHAQAGPYYVTNINFDPNNDMNFIYAADWNQHNWGYPDHWFYSNSKNMNIVGQAFDKVVEYYNPKSEYVYSVTLGWPDSNLNDGFSNEIYKNKEDTTHNLMCFERFHCIDNHKFYKWFFIDNLLYDKTKFLDITRET